MRLKKLLAGFILTIFSLAVMGQWYDFIGNLQFDTNLSTNPAHTEGLMFYDNTAKAVSYYNDDSDVTVNLGQENLIKVRNVTGADIDDGTPVFVSGSTGQTPDASLASSAYIETSITLGLWTSGTTADNGFGYVTTFGTVNGLDTSSYTEGDVLYLDTVLGQLVVSPPRPPARLNVLGIVTNSHATQGKIFVRPESITRDVALHKNLITNFAGDAQFNPFLLNFVSGDSVIFGDSGTITGTLATSVLAADQLKGTRVFKYTQSAGSLNDWIGFPQITVPQIVNTTDVRLAYNFRYKYDGDGGDLEVRARCVDDNSIILDSSSPLDPSKYKFSGDFSVPKDCNEVIIGLHVLVENSGAILLFDDIKVSDEQREVKEFETVRQYSEADGDFTTSFTNKSASIFVIVPYQTHDGAWRATINADLDTSVGATSVTVTISGLTFKSGPIQPFASMNGSSNTNNSWANGGGSTISNTSSSSTTTIRFSGDVELDGKPTWASETRSSGTVFASDTTQVFEENTFTAKIINNGTASILSEDVNVIDTVTRSALGVVDVVFNVGAFTLPPVVIAGTSVIVNRNATVYNVTAAGFSVETRRPDDASISDLSFDVFIGRQGADYKENNLNVDNLIIENFGTVVSNLNQPLNQLNSVGLSGNDGRAITTGTEDVFWSGTGTGWTGGANDQPNFYTPQYTASVITFEIGIYFNAAFTGTVNLYKNSVFYKRITVTTSGAGGRARGRYTSYAGEFTTTDNISIRCSGGAGTLSNDPKEHYLNIVEDARQLNISNFVIENASGSFETVTKTLVSGDVNSTGIINDLTLPLVIGEEYHVTGILYTSDANVTDNDKRVNVDMLDGAVNLQEISTFIRGTRNDTTMPVNKKFIATTNSLTFNTSLISNVVLKSGAKRSYIQLTKLPKEQGVDVLGEVITNHITGGTEYELKGQLEDGVQIMARTWIVGTDVTVSTGSYITGLPTGLQLINAVNTRSSIWTINSAADNSAARNEIYYDDAAGSIGITATGWMVGAGTRITITYPKP